MRKHTYGAVLTSLGLLVLAAVPASMHVRSAGAATPVHAMGGTAAPALEGTWRVKVTVPPNPDIPDGRTFDARLTFSRGGGLVESDTNPATPDGGVAQGTWARVGNQTFALTFEKFAFNPITQQTGVFKVVEVIRVDADTYSGESPAAYFCDADGTNCVLLGPATSSGTRMQAELE